MKAILLKAGLLAITLFAFVAAPAWAGNDFKERRNNQINKIRRGLRSGAITRKECAKLTREQHQIKRARIRAMADGRLTRNERHRLNGMLDTAAKHIYRTKHNKFRQANQKNRHHTQHKAFVHNGRTHNGCTATSGVGTLGSFYGNPYDQWGVSLFYHQGHR